MQEELKNLFIGTEGTANKGPGRIEREANRMKLEICVIIRLSAAEPRRTFSSIFMNIRNRNIVKQRRSIYTRTRYT